jgi:hypothetical protein
MVSITACQRATPILQIAVDLGSIPRRRVFLLPFFGKKIFSLVKFPSKPYRYLLHVTCFYYILKRNCYLLLYKELLFSCLLFYLKKSTLNLRDKHCKTICKQYLTQHAFCEFKSCMKLYVKQPKEPNCVLSSFSRKSHALLLLVYLCLCVFLVDGVANLSFIGFTSTF